MADDFRLQFAMMQAVARAFNPGNLFRAGGIAAFGLAANELASNSCRRRVTNIAGGETFGG